MDTPSGQHIVFADNGRWTVHHPLSCREAGWHSLAECWVPAAVGIQHSEADPSLPDGWSVAQLDVPGGSIIGYRSLTPEELGAEPEQGDPGRGLTHEEMLEETAGDHPHTGEPNDPLARAKRVGILPRSSGEPR
jgi:hypothetical protein